MKAMTGWMAVSASAIGGCGPRVDEFRAEPHTLCAGDAVNLRWKTFGATTLTSQPPLFQGEGGTRKVKSEGSTSVRPAQSTLFELSAASSGRTARGYVDVHVLPGAKLPPLGASIQDCDARSVWATIHPSARLWTERARLSLVRVVDGRSYQVEHEGQIAEIGPDRPSATFAGMKVRGPWILRSWLAPGERCRTKAMPHTLMIAVETECTTQRAEHGPSRAP